MKAKFIKNYYVKRRYAHLLVELGRNHFYSSEKTITKVIETYGWDMDEFVHTYKEFYAMGKGVKKIKDIVTNYINMGYNITSTSSSTTSSTSTTTTTLLP